MRPEVPMGSGVGAGAGVAGRATTGVGAGAGGAARSWAKTSPPRLMGASARTSGAGFRIRAMPEGGVALASILGSGVGGGGAGGGAAGIGAAAGGVGALAATG